MRTVTPGLVTLEIRHLKCRPFILILKIRKQCAIVDAFKFNQLIFDSFGRRPNADFERYMNRHCSSWNFSHKQLQSVVSKFCGYYCIYFCILRSRGVDMCKIVRSFSSDTGLNDALVHAYVCRR